MTRSRACSAARRDNGTLRQRSFLSLEACLDCFGISFQAKALENPLEPRGLLLLQSIVTAVQGRDMGAAAYTRRDQINFLENGNFCHFACVMLAVLQVVVVLRLHMQRLCCCVCVHESLFLHRWTQN